MTDTRRRVKVYTLNEDRQWDDKGTGHVLYEIDDRLRSTTLIVRAEQDGSSLLESKILQDTVYQKQQETLIVWSECDSTDLALSFQEKPGCDEIWEKICQVQGKDPSVSITQDVVDDGDEDAALDGGSDLGLESNEPVELPPCELSQLEEIDNLFASCLLNPVRRDRLALAIENSGYVQKLLGLFRMNEDLENVDGLHRLHGIFKTLFMLNNNSIFEVVLDDENIMDTIGCLEYDPTLAQRRHHREYLTKNVKFKEVIPIMNEELKRKIHQTFRVQYIQDVILPTPSVFEENLLSTLNSFVFFSKIEIVNMIKDDEALIHALFDELRDESRTSERRIDLAGFLRELCTFSQTLQQLHRDDFFKILADVGVLQTVESLLASDDIKLTQIAVDIFAHVVEYNPSMVREFAHKEMEENPGNDDELLINLAIEQMICDPDPELSSAMQLMNLLRTLLDPENMMPNINEKTEFLSFFYYHCMHVLMAPLLANTSGDKPKGDYQTAHLLSLILDLITFSVEHHTYHVKNYILNKDLLRRILVLLNSRHRFLALATLRFLRKIISMKDELYNRYVIKGNLLQPVVDVLFRSGSRYNLLNSAVLELFEFIRTEDVKCLIAHIAESHLALLLEKIDYVKTFAGIKQRHEQHEDRLNRLEESVGTLEIPLANSNRFRRDSRTMDEDEENWFDEEEEESDILMAFSSPSDQPGIMKVNIDKMFKSDKKDDRLENVSKPMQDIVGDVMPQDVNVTSFSPEKRSIITVEEWSTKSQSVVNGVWSTNGNSSASDRVKDEPEPVSHPVTVKTGLVGLVDYDESDDEENEAENGDKCPENGSDKNLDASKVKLATDPTALTASDEPDRKKSKLQTVGDSN